jgi:AraC-like DNA-binding protein
LTDGHCAVPLEDILNASEFFSTAGLAIAAFTAIFLICKERRQTADFTAAAFILLLSSPAVLTLTLEALNIAPGKHLFFRYILPLTFSPALFLYADNLISGKKPLRRAGVLHFLPFALALAILVSPAVGFGAGTANLQTNNRGTAAARVNPQTIQQGEAFPGLDRPPPPGIARRQMKAPPFLQGLRFAAFLSFIIYMILILRILGTHRGRIKEYFSFASSAVNLSWLGFLVIAFSAVQTYIFAAVLLSLSEIRLPSFNPLFSTDAGYGVFTAIFAYFALAQERVFFRYGYTESMVKENTDTAGAEKNKYANSALDGDRIDRCFEKLEKLMKEEFLFRDNDLTMEDVADRTGIPRHYISQTINIKTAGNFFGYINRYRAAEVVETLKKNPDERQTLLEIAFASGFNSKSSFINYFKEATGKTPQQFRNECAGAK